jgi:hypothetical protein
MPSMPPPRLRSTPIAKREATRQLIFISADQDQLAAVTAEGLHADDPTRYR